VVTHQGRTALYRFFDGDSLVYVGITSNPVQRFAQHAADKSWWPQVTRRTIEWYETRRAAEMAEQAAIKLKNPIYNVVHSTMPSETVQIELPGQWLIGLDILGNEFLADSPPRYIRGRVFAGLLYRELAARGLHGEPHCACNPVISWPRAAGVDGSTSCDVHQRESGNRMQDPGVEALCQLFGLDRDALVTMLLDRELAARGLLDGSPCYHSMLGWPTGVIVDDSCCEPHVEPEGARESR
jgi:predicted GIY-YIG superfamily endonuclease